MVKLTKAQRQALFRVFQRDFPGWVSPTHIPKIPHSVPTQWLLQKAAVTRKKVKYYMISRQSHREILIRYVTPKGNITNGKGKRYTGFAIGKPRFLNYWHAYAYKLRLEEQRKGD